MRSTAARLAPVLGILVAVAWAPGAAADGWPDWVERWLFNSGERTARAFEAVERGQAEEAVGPPVAKGSVQSSLGPQEDLPGVARASRQHRVRVDHLDREGAQTERSKRYPVTDRHPRRVRSR